MRSFTDQNRLDNCIANPYISKMGGFTGYVDMHLYAICNKKIYHEVQEILTFSLTGNGRTDFKRDYSADPRVVQCCYFSTKTYAVCTQRKSVSVA